jgi:hypothetical protein
MGFSTYPFRDILYGVAILTLVFNAGGMVFIFKNHIKHVNAKLIDIDKTLIELRNRLSTIEGRLSK